MQLYRDTNGDGSWDGGDAPIGAAIPPAGVLAFTSLGESPGVDRHQLLRPGHDRRTWSAATRRPSRSTPAGSTRSRRAWSRSGPSATPSTPRTPAAARSRTSTTPSGHRTRRTSPTGSPLITILNGTATLTVAQTGDIGVGDEIEFGGTVVYIKAVLSPTSFVVHAPDRHEAGGRRAPCRSPPSDAPSARSTPPISDSPTAPTWGPPISSTANARVYWVCYNDGPFNITCQHRHLGLHHGRHPLHHHDRRRGDAGGERRRASGTTARPEPAPSSWSSRAPSGRPSRSRRPTPASSGSRSTATTCPGAAASTAPHAGTLCPEPRHPQRLVHRPRPASTSRGVGIWVQSVAGSETIRNCVIYDYDEDGIYVNSPNATIDNTTIFRTRETVNPGEGLQVGGGTSATAANVLSMGNGADFFENTTDTLTCNNCMSEDGTADNHLGSGQLREPGPPPPVRVHHRVGEPAPSGGGRRHEQRG